MNQRLLSKNVYYITALIVFRIITVIFRFFAFGDTFFRPTAGRRTIWSMRPMGASIKWHRGIFSDFWRRATRCRQKSKKMLKEKIEVRGDNIFVLKIISK